MTASLDPLTQLRVASEMESIARTTLGFGEILVRHALTDPLAPAARLGRTLLDELEASLVRLKKPASLQERETARTAPEEIEPFLASRVPASASFLRAPFGASELRLVERDHHGHDIWWGGCFFAIPHRRSPHLAFQLLRMLGVGRSETLFRILRCMRPLHAWRAILGRSLRLLRIERPDAPRPTAVLRVPLLRLSATRTGLEMQQHITTRLRRAPRVV